MTTISVIEKIKKEVLNKLGVVDSFQLNDKIDGIFYLKKQIKRVLSSYVIEKRFNIPLIDKNKILKSKIKFSIYDTNYEIVGVEIGDKIKIPNSDVDCFIVVGFFDQFRKNKILGIISKKKALSHQSTLLISNNTVSKDLLCSITEKELERIEDDPNMMKLL